MGRVTSSCDKVTIKHRSLNGTRAAAGFLSTPGNLLAGFCLLESQHKKFLSSLFMKQDEIESHRFIEAGKDSMVVKSSVMRPLHRALVTRGSCCSLWDRQTAWQPLLRQGSTKPRGTIYTAANFRPLPRARLALTGQHPCQHRLQGRKLSVSRAEPRKDRIHCRTPLTAPVIPATNTSLGYKFTLCCLPDPWHFVHLHQRSLSFSKQACSEGINS